MSWRVHVLPYLEQVELYRQFHLDEPWDSAHNKPLIRKMPDVYKSKNRDVPQGHTVYLGVAGRNGVFVRPAPNQPGCLGIEMGEVQDGTSATAMLVRVPDEIAELWTKPGDFAPHDDDLWQRLAGENSSGVTITRVDGSTGFLPSSANVEQVRALFTRGGGELMKIEF